MCKRDHRIENIDQETYFYLLVCFATNSTVKTFTFTNFQNNRSLVKSLGMEGARLPEWVDDNNENEEKMEEGMEDQEGEKMMEGWFGGEKKRWKGENCFREEGEGDVREILALAEAQELQAKLVSANQLVEQLKEEVKRLKKEQENNMAELISEHRQDLEEERQRRERERRDIVAWRRNRIEVATLSRMQVGACVFHPF